MRKSLKTISGTATIFAGEGIQFECPVTITKRTPTQPRSHMIAIGNNEEQILQLTPLEYWGKRPKEGEVITLEKSPDHECPPEFFGKWIVEKSTPEYLILRRWLRYNAGNPK